MSEHNSISAINEELDRVILWQYDNSNLVGFVQLLADFLGQSTKQFWEDWQRDVVNVDTANDFGLAVWGKVLGIERPVISTGTISTELFRKIVKARFELMNSSAAIPDYIKYVDAIFGEGTVTVTDGSDMSISFGKYTGEDEELSELNINSLIPYPAGVRDNSEASGRFLAFVETDGATPSASIYPRAGGFDESTFNWKEGENINDAS